MTTAFITGANSGIGFETALQLSKKGISGILACRNIQDADLAIQRIKKTVPDASLQAVKLDLANFESIKSCVANAEKQIDGIDLLINNAGIMGLKNRAVTKQGFEAQFGTNHLGHFALTALLFPLIKNRDGARIITVTALRYKSGEINFDDLQSESKYSPFAAYSQSKLANLLFSQELHRRLQSKKISVKSIAVHPGLSTTNLFLNGPGKDANAVLRTIFKGISKIIGQDPERGALPTVYAATSRNAISGEYYGPDGWKELRGNPTKIQPNQKALDADLAMRLWSVSEKLTGITFLES